MAHGESLRMRHAGDRTRPIAPTPQKPRDRSLNGKARRRHRRTNPPPLTSITLDDLGLLSRLHLDPQDVLLEGFAVDLGVEEAVVTYYLRSDPDRPREARLPVADVAALMGG